VLGQAAVIIPEFEVDAWSVAIQALLADPARRTRLSALGTEHAARYSWGDTAKKTWDVYRKVLS
jgi:D-inositol-3-phosphate glycosyltransferase